jgi:hypothetical protein
VTLRVIRHNEKFFITETSILKIRSSNLVWVTFSLDWVVCACKWDRDITSKCSTGASLCYPIDIKSWNQTSWLKILKSGFMISIIIFSSFPVSSHGHIRSARRAVSTIHKSFANTYCARSILCWFLHVWNGMPEQSGSSTSLWFNSTFIHEIFLTFLTYPFLELFAFTFNPWK